MFAFIKFAFWFAKTQQQFIFSIFLFSHLEEYLSIFSAAALTHHNAGHYRQLPGRCYAVAKLFWLLVLHFT